MCRINLIIRVFFLICVVFLNACKNDNEEDASIVCQPDKATYSSIKIIFESNCISCHSKSYNNDNVILDSYEGVKEASAKMLLPAIKHETGVTSMPYNGQKLSDCEIQSIESWISRNFPQ